MEDWRKAIREVSWVLKNGGLFSFEEFRDELKQKAEVIVDYLTREYGMYHSLRTHLMAS